MTGAPISFHFHAEVWLGCALLLGLYFTTLRRLGPVFHPSREDPPATAWQRARFVLGVLMLLVASASPLHDIGEQRLFSAHMVQHLLHAFVVAPLILTGTPTWMARLFLRRTRLLPILTRLGKPLLAAIIFNAVLMIVHVPVVIDAMVTSAPLHATMHLSLLAAAFLMWLPVASPVPEIPRLSPPAQMGYLFLQTLLPTVPASFLTFGTAPLYSVYVDMPRLWGISALNDMRFAGLLMKLGGGFLLWSIITVKFFQWSASQERDGDAGDDRDGGKGLPPAPTEPDAGPVAGPTPTTWSRT